MIRADRKAMVTQITTLYNKPRGRGTTTAGDHIMFQRQRHESMNPSCPRSVVQQLIQSTVYETIISDHVHLHLGPQFTIL